MNDPFFPLSPQDILKFVRNLGPKGDIPHMTYPTALNPNKLLPGMPCNA